MASVTELFAALEAEANRVQAELIAKDKTDELSDIFLDAIRVSLSEIKLGADSDEFSELSVVNFIIGASQQGYSPEEINRYVRSLTTRSGKEAITVI